MDMNHWKLSYFHSLMGYSSVWGVGELALWGGASVLEGMANSRRDAVELSQ